MTMTATYKHFETIQHAYTEALTMGAIHYGPDLEACAMWVWAKSMGPVTVEDVMESVRASVAQLRRLSRGAAGVYHVGCVKVTVDQGGWAVCRIEGGW